jgi:hypothetical protein
MISEVTFGSGVLWFEFKPSLSLRLQSGDWLVTAVWFFSIHSDLQLVASAPSKVIKFIEVYLIAFHEETT